MENVMMPIARSKDQSGRVEAHYKREGGGGDRRRGTWLVAGFCLPRDHGVRFPDRAAFATGSFQAFVGDFGPKCGTSLYGEAGSRGCGRVRMEWTVGAALPFLAAR